MTWCFLQHEEVGWPSNCWFAGASSAWGTLLLSSWCYLLPPKRKHRHFSGTIAVLHSEQTTKTQLSECEIAHWASSKEHTRLSYPAKALCSCRQEQALLLAGRKRNQKELVLFVRLMSTCIPPAQAGPVSQLVHTICHLDEINVVMTNAPAFPTANLQPGWGSPCNHWATWGFSMLGAGTALGVRGICFLLTCLFSAFVLMLLLLSISSSISTLFSHPFSYPLSLPKHCTLPHAEKTCCWRVSEKLVLLLPKSISVASLFPPPWLLQKKSQSQNPYEPMLSAMFFSSP